MRKRASAIAFLAWGGVLLIALVLASCSNSPVTHTVSFDPQNGDEIFTITVQDGMAADKPEDPERDGYIFQGWHTDPNNHADETVYDFSSPVASDITLYAGWEEEYTPPPTYTVSFNANGGTEIPDQRVTSGSTAEKPADPIRGGYSFAGWYSDEGLQTEYLFTEPMASSITLHAKWIALYTVTFTYDSSKYSNSNITIQYMLQAIRYMYSQGGMKMALKSHLPLKAIWTGILRSMQNGLSHTSRTAHTMSMMQKASSHGRLRQNQIQD